MRASIAVAVLAASACGSKPRPVDPPSNKPATEPAPRPAEERQIARAGASATLTDAEFDAIMGRAIKMFDAMGVVADQVGHDCGKFADGLDRTMIDHHQFIEDAKRWKGNPDLDCRAEAWMKDHQDQIMGPMMKVAGAGQKCANDPKFKATMERLSKLGE